jgi:hypothetical protein
MSGISKATNPTEIIAAIEALDLHAPQQLPTAPIDFPQAPDGLCNIDTLRGGVSVELATSIKAMSQRKLGSCRNLASYLM